MKHLPLPNDLAALVPSGYEAEILETDSYVGPILHISADVFTYRCEGYYPLADDPVGVTKQAVASMGDTILAGPMR